MAVNVRLGNREVRLEEVAGLRMIRANRFRRRHPGSDALLDDLRRSARVRAEASVPDRPLREELERNGWIFSLEERDRDLSLFTGRETWSRRVNRRLLRDTRSGRLMIEANAVTAHFKAPLSAQEVKTRLSALTGVEVRRPRRLHFGVNLWEAVTPPGKSVEAVAQAAGSQELHFIEPQLARRMSHRIGADPNYEEQWQWKNGSGVNAEGAWAKAGLGTGARVAVIDDGFEIGHADLKAGIGGGGYFTDAFDEAEYDGPGGFVAQGVDDGGFPSFWHGTFVLGMAGARIDNGVCGAGMAPDADLLPYALGGNWESQAAMAKAIGEAVLHENADVISCSLGDSLAMDGVLRLAIDYAVDQGRGQKGTPVFWAVSNVAAAATADDEICSYANTIAVGASDEANLKYNGAVGAGLEFLAPGFAVGSTWPGDKFAIRSGSSFATPVAAAIAALVIRQNPGWTWKEVRDKLRDSCDKIGPNAYVGNGFGGRNDEYGYGRLNAETAVS